jgi:hypothetical protein
VTLFAAGGSQTSARFVACSPRGLRLAGIRDHLASHLVMLNEVYERANEFDVIDEATRNERLRSGTQRWPEACHLSGDDPCRGNPLRTEIIPLM